MLKRNHKNRRRHPRQLLNTSVQVFSGSSPVNALGINLSDVGMCLFDETTNAGNGHYSVTMVATETTQGVMRLGPQTS